MIHFFPRFSKTAEQSPFGAILREIGAPHRIFGSLTPQNYRYRVQLLLIGYPRLAWAALAAAVKSLLGGGQPPDAVVISSDVEALVFALVRLWPGAAKPRIVFVPFIFTQRRSPAVNWARLAYYRFVLRRVSCAICHSSLEVERYRALFAGCGAAFVFVPWGTHVPAAGEIQARTIQAGIGPVCLSGTMYCHKPMRKSYSELGFRRGRSAPSTMACGRSKAYRPRKLMCLNRSGETRATSVSLMLQPSWVSWSMAAWM